MAAEPEQGVDDSTKQSLQMVQIGKKKGLLSQVNGDDLKTDSDKTKLLSETIDSQKTDSESSSDSTNKMEQYEQREHILIIATIVIQFIWSLVLATVKFCKTSKSQCNYSTAYIINTSFTISSAISFGFEMLYFFFRKKFVLGIFSTLLFIICVVTSWQKMAADKKTNKAKLMQKAALTSTVLFGIFGFFYILMFLTGFFNDEKMKYHIERITNRTQNVSLTDSHDHASGGDTEEQLRKQKEKEELEQHQHEVI